MRIILWLMLATALNAGHDHGKGKGHVWPPRHDVPTSEVPEPATIAVTGVALMGLAAWRAMRRGR